MKKIWATALLPVAFVLLFATSAAAAGPELTISPSPVSFEKTTVGEESPTVTVEVQNVGDSGGSVESSAVEGLDAADFKHQGSDCGWIEPGQKCNVWMRFAPGGSGDRAASLAVRLKEGPEATVALSGTAVAPQLSIGPSSLDFGIQRLNQSNSQGLQVTNSGEAGVRIGSVGTEGKDSNNFWVSSNDCWNGRWLSPGESCWLQVTFNPWSMQSYEAVATVFADNVGFSATLTGTGGEAFLAPATNPVEFGSAEVGGEGRLQTIVLRNEGNLGGSFFIAVIAGGDVGSFELIDENCTGEEIAPGATCVAHVRFDPAGLGTKIARLAMFGDGGGGAMVFLRGEGVPAAVTPESHDGIVPMPGRAPRKGERFVRGKALRGPARCQRVKVCKRARVFRARVAPGG
ncbi:MAG TPA: choice-of-anchor D domain-containing protein [Solirubrobacterales bacterium]|nr:choice-of-anchor D domain-containing protein [Solirubrobacterales bacterium]